MKLRLLSVLALLSLPLLAFSENDAEDYSRFICPADVTITCGDFRNLHGNYSYLGQPDYSPYCITNLEEKIANDANFCGLGKIYRTWTALDVCSWKEVTCTQTINIVAPPESWVVQFPADLVLECTSVDDLPDFGQPILLKNDCDDVKFNYQDEVFESVEDACYKVVRTWTAINWCYYNINSGDRVRELSELDLVRNETDYDFNEDLDNDGDEDRRTYQVGVFDVRNTLHRDSYGNAHPNFLAPDADGYVTHKQIIKVRDSFRPEISTIDDLDICIETGCTTSITLPEVEIFDCSERLSGRWTTNISDLNAVTEGNYVATYQVTDNCGNYAQQSIDITVIDCAPPVSYCRGLSIDLMVTGEVTIWANDFNVGSFDACTDVELAFSTNPRDTGLTFTCDNLGSNVVQIYTIDPSGNFSICEAIILVGDSQFACTEGEPGRLVGTVFTPGFEYVDDVAIKLSGNGERTAMTNELGFYDLRGLERGYDYSIVPQKDTLPAQGIDNWDLQILVKHVLGLEPITDPYRLIAADVDNSGVINTQDIVVLRRMIGGGMEHFPNNTAWRFVRKDFEMNEGENPLHLELPELVNINNLDTSLTVLNFFAIKVGDLDRSWESNLSVAPPTHLPATELAIFTETPVVSPNPFVETTTLRFDLLLASEVKLTVTDVTGRELLRETRTLDAGQQQWSVAGIADSATGILLYQLETNVGTYTGKVIRL